MTIIAMATKNPVKLKAVAEAFEIILRTKEVEVHAADARSEVREQPVDEDVAIGAENRLKNLKKIIDKEADYYVACEGGLINYFNQYYNVQYVVIEDKFGHKSTGISQGYPIPQKYLNKVITENLAKTLDEIFDGKGGLRKLTNGTRTREDMIIEAVIMALTGIINGSEWMLQ